jgi:glutathione S-transferase
MDPNTNVTLWESNAIIKYLVDTYDKENKLTYTSIPEKYHVEQWSFFQASGQGPYFGQAAWLVILEHTQCYNVALQFVG